MEDMMERGAAAENASDYVKTIIKEAKEIILDRIVALQPDQTILFTVYKSELIALDDILSVLAADIINGKNAISEIQNAETRQNGIL